MSIPTITSLAPLLDRLFDQDEAARGAMRAAFADVTDADRARMMRSKTAYRDLYGRLKDAPLAVSRETGHLLYILARSSRAKAIVEFGTSFGISTLHLAAGLRDNGGGRLITTEFEPSKAARARENLAAGGLLDLVEIREGDALKMLRVDLPDTIDLVLLDGARRSTPTSWIWSKAISGRARSSSPTMPTTAPTIWRACAGPEAATCPRALPRTSNSRCGSTDAPPHRAGATQ
ncbi:putative O-methyltransferase YrrM [Bradyrhizobium sp. F1.13.1]